MEPQILPKAHQKPLFCRLRVRRHNLTPKSGPGGGPPPLPAPQKTRKSSKKLPDKSCLQSPENLSQSKKNAIIPPKEGVVVEWATAARGTSTVAKTFATSTEDQNTSRQHHWGPLSPKDTVAVWRLRLLDIISIERGRHHKRYCFASFLRFQSHMGKWASTVLIPPVLYFLSRALGRRVAQFRAVQVLGSQRAS